MSTNIIVGLVIGTVIVLGGGYYLATSGGYTMSESSTVVDLDRDGVDDVVVASAFTGSFMDLATRGGTHVCTVSSVGAAAGTTGTVYVSGADLRGDFSTVTNGVAVESHMIKKGGTMYMWGGGMEKGIQLQATATMTDGSTSDVTAGKGVSGTQSYGWDCSADVPDASKFVKPSNIEFMDMSAMMGGSGAGMIPNQ